MDKDPTTTAFLWLMTVIIGGTFIFVAGVFMLPFVLAGMAIWFGVKWYKSSQAKAEAASRDAVLHAAVANPIPVPEPLQFAKNFFLDFSQLRKNNNQLMPAYPIMAEAFSAIQTIYQNEEINPSQAQPASNSAMDVARWRDRTAFLAARAQDPKLIEIINQTFTESFSRLAGALPPMALQTHKQIYAAMSGDDERNETQVKLMDVIPNFGQAIGNFISAYYSNNAIKSQLFVDLREQIDRNMHELSGIPFTEENKGSTKLILPHDYKGTPQEIVRGYLRNTPLEEIFECRVSFTPPEETRFEHSWLCAGSGHGKTNAISTMIEHDLEAVIAGQCSIVVMDSQNQIIPTIANLDLFAPGGPLHGKLVHIDPSDIEYPVQLNLFAIGKERLNSYSMLERERLLNSVIELYDFVLSSLLGSEMTARQGTLFRFATQLMMVVPDATIHTFRELMQPGGYDKFKPYIDQLGGTAKEFFDTQFNGKIFEQTKQQVVARLFTICENRTFERLFTHPQSKLDLFTEINAGKVILINTAKDLLKQQGTEVFGRFFLALIGQAAQERATLANKMPVFCYIDECQDYIAADSNFTVILEQARKQKIGMIVAHQYLTQLSGRTLDSLYANTSIKYAGGVSDKDAHALARNMSAEPAFILQQSKGTFASYIRNYTKNAVSLQFPLTSLSKKPRMTSADRAGVLAELREKYAVPLSYVQPVKADVDRPSGANADEFADRY